MTTPQEGAVQVLFDGEMHVAYGFLHLLPPNTDFVDLIFARGGQANGLCGAAQPGVLAMTTGGAMPASVMLGEVRAQFDLE